MLKCLLLFADIGKHMTIKMQSFAYRLKFARSAKNLSQDKLAELSGVNRSNIVAFECGNVITTSSGNINNLARHIGLTPEFLEHGVINGESLDVEIRQIAIQLQKMRKSDRKKMVTTINAIIDTWV